VENWNDDRLDELSLDVKEGFARMDRKLDQQPTREEINQRFESTERRIDRVSSRLEHMVWAMLIVGGGFLGNLLTDKI
jgi:hypothetical protein